MIWLSQPLYKSYFLINNQLISPVTTASLDTAKAPRLALIFTPIKATDLGHQGHLTFFIFKQPMG